LGHSTQIRQRPVANISQIFPNFNHLLSLLTKQEFQNIFSIYFILFEFSYYTFDYSFSRYSLKSSVKNNDESSIIFQILIFFVKIKNLRQSFRPYKSDMWMKNILKKYLNFLYTVI